MLELTIESWERLIQVTRSKADKKRLRDAIVPKYGSTCIWLDEDKLTVTLKNIVKEYVRHG